MPKLKTSVNKNEDNNENNENKSVFSLSTKVERQNDNNSQSNENTTKITKLGKSTKVQSISSVTDITNWIVNLIGEDIFKELKENPNFQLPYTDDDINTKEWLSKSIKTLFTKENIAQMGSQIQASQAEVNQLAQVANKIEEEKKAMLEKYNLKFQALKEEVENAEDNKYRIEKELNTAVPLTSLISEFYRDPEDRSPELKKLISTLHTALEEKDSNVSKFILRFSKGWFVIKSTISKLGEDEKQNLDNLHNATRELLSYISNTFISERRPLLDIIAKICSNQFTNYDFISPEQTLQPDPEIHDAGGLGISTIKEGITFAVVRKDTRKAVKYAEIKMS